MKSVPDIIVVGTDTGVGKSVFSLMLMQFLHAKNYAPFYLKPFQTGCVGPYDVDSDAAFVYQHTAALKGKDPAQSVIYCYPNPKAPFFAACDAGEKIDLDRVRLAIEQKRSLYNPVIVEAAGGLLVPVTQDLTVLDLIPTINCRPVLVARAGLGTINHTLLSIEALHRRKIDPLGVVFVESGQTHSDPNMVSENMTAVEKHGGIRVSGVIPALSDFKFPPVQAYQCIEEILNKA